MNQADRPFVWLNKINKIETGREDITTNFTEIKRETRTCCEQHCWQFNPGEILRFLQRHRSPKPIQEEVGVVNTTVTHWVTWGIRNLTKESPSPDSFSDEFYWTFIEELIAILPGLFGKIERRKHFPFHETSIALMAKPHENLTRKPEQYVLWI